MRETLNFGRRAGKVHAMTHYAAEEAGIEFTCPICEEFDHVQD